MGDNPVIGQTEHVARAARIAGAITTALGVIILGIMLFLAVLLTDIGRQVRADGAAIRIAVLIGFYLLPGGLLWWLGRRLDAGSSWAFIPIGVVDILCLASGLIPLVIGASLMTITVSVVVHLPQLYSFAVWLNGISDYRDFRRRLRRQRTRNAPPEAVAATGSASDRPYTAPPPPVRVPPRPRL